MCDVRPYWTNKLTVVTDLRPSTSGFPQFIQQWGGGGSTQLQGCWEQWEPPYFYPSHPYPDVSFLEEAAPGDRLGIQRAF